jgi:thiol-disulfide isomerase/thioredoxin
MKKIILALFVIALSTTLVFAITPKKKEKPSDYNIGIKYEQAIKNDKPAVVLFYTDWCTYCRGFMPMYESISTIYKDKYNFVMVNAEKDKTLSRDYTINSLPTLYIIDPKIDNRVHLDNGIYGSKYLLQKELDRYLNVRARIK